MKRQPDWIRSSLVQKITNNQTVEMAVKLEKAWVDDNGERQITKLWLSLDEARELTQSLIDLLRDPPQPLDFSKLNQKP